MLHIRLFGGFEADLDGEPMSGMGHQLRRLLALLTLEANRPVEMSRVWQEIWPDSDTPDAVRKSFQRLRTSLNDEAWRLKTEGGRACLDLDGAVVDIFQFATLIDQGDNDSLEQAIRIYHGELLPDWEANWLVPFREKYEVDYLGTLKKLASQSFQAQDYLKAAHYLRRFVNTCPGMESGWEALLDTYAVSNNRSKALEVYRAYVDFLRRQSKAGGVELKPSPRMDAVIRGLVKQEQRDAVSQIWATTSAAIDNSPPAYKNEPVGGAVPITSPYYVERPEDADVYVALAQPGSTILIKGPRQIGKTSLLARALGRARQSGSCVLLTDWQNLAHAELASAENFFLSLAYSIAEQLNVDDSPTDFFLPKRPPSANFERFFRRCVFPAVQAPIVWGIDEADRLFACAFCDDVFAKLRAWHNERALSPEGPWTRLTIILAYSTEANLFIQNMNQSPFNVGTRVTLCDFTFEQVEELNRRYGLPLRSLEEIRQLYALLGGHPYLVRRSLVTMARYHTDISTIEASADRDDSIFSDHLERMRFALLLDAELTEAVRQWLRAETVPTQKDFGRLCAAGLITGSAPQEIRLRCQLYERYLKRHLL